VNGITRRGEGRQRRTYLGNPEIAARYATVYLDGGGSPADLASPWFDEPAARSEPRPGRTCEAGIGH